jgi:hypothetical protein
MTGIPVPTSRTGPGGLRAELARFEADCAWYESVIASRTEGTSVGAVRMLAERRAAGERVRKTLALYGVSP